jgi:hypothetical protein
VLSEHKNQVDTFQRNFAKVADPFSKLNRLSHGYASEDDKNQLIRFGARPKQSEVGDSTKQETQTRSERTRRQNRLDIKEILEMYAEFQRKRKAKRSSPLSEKVALRKREKISSS